MADVVKEAKTDHGLDWIPSNRQYETRMQGGLSRRSCYQIQLWIGRRMLVSMPNAFDRSGSQGGRDVLIMRWQAVCLF